MKGSIQEKLNMKRREAFPSNLEELKLFLSKKGMAANKEDEDALKSLINRLNKGEPPSEEGIKAIHRLLDLGDTCGCDSDHRIRNRINDGKKIGYSRT